MDLQTWEQVDITQVSSNLWKKKLIEKTIELREITKSDLVKACGDVLYARSGGERLNYT